MDFEPSDEVMIQTYLNQIKFFELIKIKYNRRVKIHDFIEAYINNYDNNLLNQSKNKPEN